VRWIQQKYGKQKLGRHLRKQRVEEHLEKLYKACGDVAVKELIRLFKRIWHDEKVPDQSKKGLKVKIPKRGDLKEYKN